MDTRTICLALLSRGEASGYEIKKCIAEDFAFFLEVSHSSIYPALSDMHREGLVSLTEVHQASRPDKKLYRLTEAGERALVDGLVRSPGRHRLRSEFIALLLFAEYLPVERLTELFDARMADFRRLAEQAEAMREGGCGDTPGRQFVAGLGATMVGAGLDYIQANRGWLEKSVRKGGREAVSS